MAPKRKRKAGAAVVPKETKRRSKASSFMTNNTNVAIKKEPWKQEEGTMEKKISFGKPPVDFECLQKLGKAPFRLEAPPVITNTSEIQKKVLLLATLGDILVATKRTHDNADLGMHPADANYNSLKCDLVPLEATDADYQMVENYISRTHAKTHNQYTLTVQDVFMYINTEQSDKFKDLGNNMLLWHGSHITNWVGILRDGLRVAPEAPVTGYWFRKGICFTDMCSKSANYCFASRKNDKALLLLSEVSLGNTQDMFHPADYNAKLPEEKNRVDTCPIHHSTSSLTMEPKIPRQGIPMS